MTNQLKFDIIVNRYPSLLSVFFTIRLLEVYQFQFRQRVGQKIEDIQHFDKVQITPTNLDGF